MVASSSFKSAGNKMCSDKDNIVGDENNYQTETESESENEMGSQETKHNFLETIQVDSTLRELTIIKNVFFHFSFYHLKCLFKEDGDKRLTMVLTLEKIKVSFCILAAKS